MTKSMDGDEFALTLEKMLKDVGVKSTEVINDVVASGVRQSAKSWRKRAKRLWPSGDGGHTYVRGGKTYHTGKYSKSIRSHMLRKDGQTPVGEAGSPKMPGLAHLLEHGHAKVGGGSVKAFPHVKPAADEAFKYTLDLLDDKIGSVFDDI